MIQKPKGHWHYNKPTPPCPAGNVKKPEGFEEWFYTGPSWYFGHAKPIKKKGKKG